MSGPIKKLPFVVGVPEVRLPSLPDKPDALDVVDGGDHDPSAVPNEPMPSARAVPAQYMIPAIPDSLCSNPNQMLQRNLGELRNRIVGDPEGVEGREAMGSYWARVGAMTLSNLLEVESRIWRKHLETGGVALKRVAMQMYCRILRHENYPLSAKELFACSDSLRAVIASDDIVLCSEALIAYEDFVKTLFKGQPVLLADEICEFRTAAEGKIRSALSGDASQDVCAETVSHLNNLLAVYAGLMFCGRVDLSEIQDGIEWVESYAQEGHPLEQCAGEVLITLNMVRGSHSDKTRRFSQSAPVRKPKGGNNLEPVAGEIIVGSSKTKKPD